ncbi:MAG: hypothetical protein E7350_00175 [Clostridiales bacterium]|nr:hypothetical protein [Clostridiales bacterium]
MKKIVCLIIAVLLTLACVSCGDNVEYSGVYTRSTAEATFTVTLGKDGSFKFEREYKRTNSYNPFDNPTNNIRKGTYSVENDEIVISFSYYEEAERDMVDCVAYARVSDGKLIITDESRQISGTYTKK